MSQQSFLEKVQKNLTANGFPEKKVAFPLEALYEKADEAGVNFNKIREELKSLGINTETSGEKIIFSMDTDKGNLFKKAQDMMDKMSPEQRNELMNKFQNMSEEEKAALYEQGKKMGLI